MECSSLYREGSLGTVASEIITQVKLSDSERGHMEQVCPRASQYSVLRTWEC